jgi:hypothetical protein
MTECQVSPVDAPAGGAFLDMKGFSWADLIVQQLVERLPWGHNLVLLTKLKMEKT